MVLVVPTDYAEAFAAGKPAVVQLGHGQVQGFSRQKHGAGAATCWRITRRAVAALRLLARGVDPRTVAPLAMEDMDVSTPQSRAALLLSFVPYFFLFAAILGAFYLAIDSTAGERERGSLEPLLTTAMLAQHAGARASSPR